MTKKTRKRRRSRKRRSRILRGGNILTPLRPSTRGFRPGQLRDKINEIIAAVKRRANCQDADGIDFCCASNLGNEPLRGNNEIYEEKLNEIIDIVKKCGGPAVVHPPPLGSRQQRAGRSHSCLFQFGDRPTDERRPANAWVMETRWGGNQQIQKRTKR